MLKPSIKIEIRDEIAEIISDIKPYDNIEECHIQETQSWIQSGAPLFRIAKPDIPNKHLVSYFVLFDIKAQKILLVDHKKAGLWLPAGGHVEIDEHPYDTVVRECAEELSVNAEFWFKHPLFLTSTETVGAPRHRDVSLWYVLKGSEDKSYAYDEGEFTAIRWFDFDHIPYEQSDPHMWRFVQKLREQFKIQYSL